jgi:hypothetical protein
MLPAVSALGGAEDRLKGVSNWASQLPAPGSTLGDPGKDPIAAAVNNDFLPAVGNFLDGVNNAATVVGQAGDGVGTLVHGFDKTEQENADSVRLPGPDPTALNFRDLRLLSGDLTGRW